MTDAPTTSPDDATESTVQLSVRDGVATITLAGRGR